MFMYIYVNTYKCTSNAGACFHRQPEFLRPEKKSWIWISQVRKPRILQYKTLDKHGKPVYIYMFVSVSMSMYALIYTWTRAIYFEEHALSRAGAEAHT